MGIALSLLFKGLGLGKMLLQWIWEAIKGIFRFAIEKPFQFLVIALSLALVIVGWYSLGTSRELTKTQEIVREKTLFIKGQDRVLKQYVRALDTEKKSHVASIKRSNDAVASLKRAADHALEQAQAAGRLALKDKKKFDQLASEYGKANPSTGTSDQRIQREQDTNDQFIKDWRKAQ